MEPVAYVAVGFAPGLFLLWLVYLRNTHRPAPKDLVLRTFFLGGVAAVPIATVEALVSGPHSPLLGHMSASDAAFTAFAVAGVVEEIGKFLVVRLSMYDSPFFDEPLSGIMFGAAAALGFASVENVLYMIQGGPSIIVLRAFTSTPVHLICAVYWGSTLGHAKRIRRLNPATGTADIVAGLILAIGLHGAYDFLLMAPDGHVGFLPRVLVGGVVGAVAIFGRALASSIHRGRHAPRVRPCAKCGRSVPADARFCTSCGFGVDASAPLSCGQCGSKLGADDRFCTACGVRVGVRSTAA